MPWLRLYERPVNDMGAGMNSYLDGLMNAQGSVCSVFKTMADRFNYPMILHCRIGADRTGTIVALLEALLGCSELQMGQNYIWTSLSVNGIRDTASQDWHDVLSYLKSFDTKNSTVQAGAWNYLQHIGMSVAELIAIRIIFLNDNRQPFPSLAVRMQPVAPGTRGAAAGKRYRLALSRSPVIVENGMGKATMFDVSGKALKPEWSSRQYSRLPLGR
jgi:hypothetical protein